jgi:hypothetical protein
MPSDRAEILRLLHPPDELLGIIGHSELCRRSCMRAVVCHASTGSPVVDLSALPSLVRFSTRTASPALRQTESQVRLISVIGFPS